MKRLLLALLFSPALFAQNLSDEALMEEVQKTTFKYFWDFAHPVSGLARERSNTTFGYGLETCTSGGTGFGIMAIVVGVERGWITREEGAARVLKILKFLEKVPVYHGAFAHWIHGETGQTLPFSRKDDGGDLVETAFLMQGILCARKSSSRPSHHLLAGSRMGLVYQRKHKPTLLALESEQRLGHEF